MKHTLSIEVGEIEIEAQSEDHAWEKFRVADGLLKGNISIPGKSYKIPPYIPQMMISYFFDTETPVGMTEQDMFKEYMVKGWEFAPCIKTWLAEKSKPANDTVFGEITVDNPL